MASDNDDWALKSMEKYLNGRVAMVSGGFSGIGKSISLALAERGAALAIGSRNIDAVYVEQLQNLGIDVYGGRLNVQDMDSVNHFVAETRNKLGHIDILVNSAGTAVQSHVCGHDIEVWERVIDVNLNGVFRTIRACLPGMIDNGWGRIINIGSTAARTAKPDAAAYCASKSGLLGLSRAVALEGAPHGVTCVVVSPTWVETDMLQSWLIESARLNGTTADEEKQKILSSGSPQNRLVQPEEIAAMVAFLCHEQARGITMEDIQVNAAAHW